MSIAFRINSDQDIVAIVTDWWKMNYVMIAFKINTILWKSNVNEERIFAALILFIGKATV